MYVCVKKNETSKAHISIPNLLPNEGLNESSCTATSPAWKELQDSALAGMAQWIERWPVNQRVTGSIPSQGPRLGCGPGPWLGICERQPHTDVSLPLCLPPFPSLKRNK